jgi:hypothetical protein
MCWTPLYASKLKECIYKTWVLLQTIAVKDEPNIVSMWKSKPISQHATQNVKTHNRKQKKSIIKEIRPVVNSDARES